MYISNFLRLSSPMHLEPVSGDEFLGWICWTSFYQNKLQIIIYEFAWIYPFEIGHFLVRTTAGFRRAAAFALGLSPQETLRGQIVPRYKAAKRRRLQAVLGRIQL
jgi:hypothetical protein